MIIYMSETKLHSTGNKITTNVILLLLLVQMKVANNKKVHTLNIIETSCHADKENVGGHV